MKPAVPADCSRADAAWRPLRSNSGRRPSGSAAKRRGTCVTTIVTVRLRSGFTLLRALDPRVRLWLALLAAMSAFNVGLWIWIARSATVRTPYTEAQLLLSGVYVAVCGFRSLFPRVDLERRCLWDTWLSAIMLGRTASTIAELCFALQCGLFVHRLAEMNESPLLGAGAHAFVPLVLLAELCCCTRCSR